MQEWLSCFSSCISQPVWVLSSHSCLLLLTSHRSPKAPPSRSISKHFATKYELLWVAICRRYIETWTKLLTGCVAPVFIWTSICFAVCFSFWASFPCQIEMRLQHDLFKSNFCLVLCQIWSLWIYHPSLPSLGQRGLENRLPFGHTWDFMKFPAFTDVSCIATFPFTSFTSFTLVASKWPNLWHPKILLALLVCPGFTKIGATSIKLHGYSYRLYSYRQPSWICFDIQKSEALMFQWVNWKTILVNSCKLWISDCCKMLKNASGFMDSCRLSTWSSSQNGSEISAHVVPAPSNSQNWV